MGIIFLILALISFGIHLFFAKQIKTKKYIVEILLSYLLLFGWGIGGINAFMGHVFFPERTAALIGWVSETTFQFEVGIANLSFGVLALLCIYIRMKHFWIATIIANSIFDWGAAVGHIRQMIIASNFNPGNAGIYFYYDIVYPLIIIGLFIWLMELKKETTI
jgi:hypothetical protein